MVIIVLNGKDDSGKTTVIRSFIESLSEKDRKFICKKDEDKFNSQKDFTVPILYQGVLVAITSYGDGWDLIQSVYDNYVGFAPIMICAAHPSARFQKHFNNLENKGNTIVRINIKHTTEKPYESLLEKKYADSVDAIFKKLNEVIEKMKGGK